MPVANPEEYATIFNKAFTLSILILCTALAGCNPKSSPDVQSLAATLAVMQTAQAVSTHASAASPGVGGTPPASATAQAAATACSPLATASMDLNVRSGPGVIYDPPVGNLVTGATAAITGKSSDGKWWYISHASAPGGFGWVADTTVTTTCTSPSLAVIPAPPTPMVVGVTNVSVSVSPDAISLVGCKGPIKPLTVSATIEVSGAMKLTMHFVTQQDGARPNQTINIPKAGSQVVSDRFIHPGPIQAGRYWVELVIENQDLSTLDAQATYDISC